MGPIAERAEECLVGSIVLDAVKEEDCFAEWVDGAGGTVHVEQNGLSEFPVPLSHTRMRSNHCPDRVFLRSAPVPSGCPCGRL